MSIFAGMWIGMAITAAISGTLTVRHIRKQKLSVEEKQKRIETTLFVCFILGAGGPITTGIALLLTLVLAVAEAFGLLAEKLADS